MKCDKCGGDGWTVEARCCGVPGIGDGFGGCCGAPDLVQVQCETCEGTGRVPEPHHQDSRNG